MKEKLEAISKMSKEKIAEIKDSQALNDFKVKVLGKKGELTEILRGMKDIAAEERPVVGLSRGLGDVYKRQRKTRKRKDRCNSSSY